MTRGMFPVITLLVIASAVSRFSGPSTPVLNSNRPVPISVPTLAAQLATKPPATTTDCKDPVPCILRADLGPWSASCEFARAAQKVEERSPEVTISLVDPVSHQLEWASRNASALKFSEGQELVKGLQKIDKGARASARWCLGSLGS